MCCSHGMVWGVEGEWGLPVRRHSYGGNRVEPWRASDWLKNDEKQLKAKQSRQTRVYLGFIRPKTGTMRFGPMAGLVGCAFDLLLELPGFGPNRPRHTCFWSLPFNLINCTIDQLRQYFSQLKTVGGAETFESWPSEKGVNSKRKTKKKTCP